MISMHHLLWLWRTQSIVRYNLVYRKAAKSAIFEKKVILFSPNFDFMDSSFDCIYKELLLQDYDVLIINNHKNNQKNIEYFIKEAATAHFIFSTDNSRIIDCIKFRKETKVICLWHACGALKKWGNSKVKYWKQSSFLHRKLFSYQSFNLFTVSSEKCLSFYSEATGISLKKNVLKATGVSRTDVFFDKSFLAACKNKKNKLTDKKIILYAPTFRGNNFSEAHSPEFLDFDKLRNEFSNEYIFLIKHHPAAMSKTYFVPENCKDFIFDASREYDISELIVMSDVLIGDYSSLFFEWSLFDKPILFLTPDLELYSKGFYIDFESLIQKNRVNDTNDVIKAIKNLADYDFSFLKQIRNDFMSACDGSATKRILQEMLK